MSNYEELINRNSFQKSHFLKVIDYYEGEKLCYLIKIRKETINEARFYIYIREKLLNVSDENTIEDIKLYIENKIINKIFRNE